MADIRDIYNIIDGLYPFSLSKQYIDKYGGHDNSGIIINLGKDITKVLWTLDLSPASVAAAKEAEANLIITHHPAIYYPISALDASVPSSKALIDAVAGGISVISAHLNTDFAAGGVDERLSGILNVGGKAKILQPLSDNEGYGREFSIPQGSLKNLFSTVCNSVKTKRGRLYGDGDKIITRAAFFCGGGFESAFFKALDAQVIVGSDLQHYLIAEAVERDIAVIEIPHYSAENYSFKKIYSVCKGLLMLPSVYFEDERLL